MAEMDIEMKKPVVLTLVAHYLPGYKSGGPIRTIANLADRLGDEVDFKIIAQDRDVYGSQPYKDIVANQWNKVGKAEVFYCAPSRMSLLSLRRILSATAYDVLYLNSFFDRVFTIKPLLLRRLNMIPACPVVIAPRGEFSRGAVEIKAWKKKPYFSCVKAMGLYRDLVWQASSVYEAADIKAMMGAVAERIVVAIDLAPMPGKLPEPCWKAKSSECLRIVFLSRISPMKNLDYALNVLKNVNARVCCDIYGTMEDRFFWEACQNIIDTMPGNVAVEYKGDVPHEDVRDILPQYDLFFLPTRGENYGHVIHEALLSGLPVLISDQTPWRDLPEKKAGWDLPLDDPMAFARWIEEVAAMDAEKHRQMRVCARQYGQQSQNDEAALLANRRLFMDLKDHL